LPRIVGYARVSTNRQEEDGLSIDAQRRRLIEAGAGEVLIDVMSGAKDGRPKFRELMRLVKTREIDAVLVCKLDRLTRSITARAEIYTAFTAPGAPTLRVLDDGIDLGTAAGRQMFDLLGAIATGERERIRERIKDGLAEREHRGLLVGQCPWGLRLTRSGVGVEIDTRLEPSVRDVLRILAEERSLSAGARRIATELTIVRSRASWKTWLSSPQLAGGIPRGCRDQLRRTYDSVRLGAFESYLSELEQHRLLAKFSGQARGRRSTYPHPTRQRAKCGACGSSLQRRNDRQNRPRWLNCLNVHCSLRGRCLPIDAALDALCRAAFHFSRQRIEAALAVRQQPRASTPGPRELELESTLMALRRLPADLVADAINKAESELRQLQARALTQVGEEALDLPRVVDLLELVAQRALDVPGPEELERLDDLFRLAAVEIVTAEDHNAIAYGKPRLVVGHARCGEAFCSEAELPSIATAGGSFEWRELAAALRLTF
jgi:DNA invertase Pin-like site-specific DNA recombinase